ncbi:nuclear transport factor 2 family protein [Microbacterium sp.]|uniref:nuclear transport factor 2 family protein n=1 Tax=Microbacterium sp. TaxID=51671 RepID=UPI002811BD61|nr:nuclear transport factor 2 family protein [Microbacterium sp.]
MSSSIPDATHATPAVAERVAAYQGVKTNKDVAATVGYFSRDLTTYSDAVLGWKLPSAEAVNGLFSQYMPNWGEGRSYAKKVIGDENGAVVFVTNTPELFGSEIQTISTIDFRDGKIARFVDYWDGRAFGAELAAQLRVPAAEFPDTFGEELLTSSASAELASTIDALHDTLTANTAESLSGLLHPDVHFEDFTLRISVRGRKAVSEYLATVAKSLPYGARAQMRHTVGGDLGGAYEWTNPSHAVTRGVTAIERTDGLISGITAVWDGTMADDDTIVALMTAARA